MKVYTKYKSFRYPEEMKKIMNYLNTNRLEIKDPSTNDHYCKRFECGEV